MFLITEFHGQWKNCILVKIQGAGLEHKIDAFKAKIPGIEISGNHNYLSPETQQAHF